MEEANKPVRRRESSQRRSLLLENSVNEIASIKLKVSLKDYENVVLPEVSTLQELTAKISSKFKALKVERKQDLTQVASYEVLDDKQKEFLNSLPDYSCYLEDVSKCCDLIKAANTELMIQKCETAAAMEKLSVQNDLINKRIMDDIKTIF